MAGLPLAGGDTAEFDVELRGKQFGAVHEMLRNASMYSIHAQAPQLPLASGGLFLFDEGSNSDDGIAWQKRCLKMILCDPSGVYRIKNHKTDPGEVAIRRQTWDSRDPIDGSVWRKQEFRLVDSRVFTVEDTTNTFESHVVLENPRLVHYYKRTLRKERYGAGRKAEAPAAAATTSSDGLTLGPAASPFAAPARSHVVTYAPSVGPSVGGSLVIVVVDGFPANASYMCRFQGRMAVRVERVSGNTYQFVVPGGLDPGAFPPPGISSFELAAVDANGAQVAVTPVLPFFFTPSDPTGRVAVSMRDPVMIGMGLSVPQVVPMFRYHVRELDLTGCDLADLTALEGFSVLAVLFADRNLVTSASVFPHLPSLVLLSLENNLIEDLPQFLDRLAAAGLGSSLSQLSLVGNPCVAAHDPDAMRSTVAAHLPLLQVLNHSSMTPPIAPSGSSLMMDTAQAGMMLTEGLDGGLNGF